MELYDRYKKGFEKVVKMDQEREAEIKPDPETKNEIERNCESGAERKEGEV